MKFARRSTKDLFLNKPVKEFGTRLPWIPRIFSFANSFYPLNLCDPCTKNLLRYGGTTLISILIVIAATVISACSASETLILTLAPTLTDAPLQFDGERALQHIAAQLDFGPRTPGSEGHEEIVPWMVAELQSENWDVSVQEIPYGEYTIQNVIAKRGQGAPWIILGAHYDTRFHADNDPDPEKHTQPVPGANDGASGVAVLLELARGLPADLQGKVWLVFFDAEDNGRIPGWDWIMGSQAFVLALEGQPDAVVIVDMIGDADLNIYQEKNSDQVLTQEIWKVAETLGYGDKFMPALKYSMLDDHTPFLRAGIPAVDIIDFDYPYWHTVEDTIDKVSARSLQAVGDVVLTWLLTKMSIESVP